MKLYGVKSIFAFLTQFKFHYVQMKLSENYNDVAYIDLFKFHYVQMKLPYNYTKGYYW